MWTEDKMMPIAWGQAALHLSRAQAFACRGFEAGNLLLFKSCLCQIIAGCRHFSATIATLQLHQNLLESAGEVDLDTAVMTADPLCQQALACCLQASSMQHPLL